MLDKRLLEILACPRCKGELEYQVDSKENDRGKLTCRSCRLVYAIERDIPNMLIDQAAPLEAPAG